MIRFDQFTLARGVKPLFEKTSFTLNPGEKAGLVGANGAGKSSLFAVLRGTLQADAGDASWPLSWRIAHVAQETPATERSALDYTLDGDTVLREIEAQIARAHAAHDGLAEGNAHAAFADADGYTAPARAQALLLGLGFTLAQTQQSVAHFSGGWRMRLNLAQALMCRSDLLLLDEPTNHLDLDAIVWLEDWLNRYAGTLIVISHDREFLDAVCASTLHIDQQQITRYGGNYSQFELLRAQQLNLQQSAYDKQQRNIAHLQSFISRFKAKASKARQAQSRVKALEKMEQIASVQTASPFSFSFRTAGAAPNPMLTLDDIQCGYRSASRDVAIVNDLTLSIQNGQRIGLLGANGQGKSTLVKTLAGVLPPLVGNMHTGKGLRIGYFAQHQLETLRDADSPLQHLIRLAPEAREQELRSFLGSFNFSGNTSISPIAPFSGGEKARLALALMIWLKPNLLLLDEPTNHLDLETREALTLALAQFDGTLIVVSHDRHLLRAVCDQFMLVANHRLQPFDGDLDDYRAWLLRDAAAKRSLNNHRDTSQTSNNTADRKAERRAQADLRQQAIQSKKPIQQRITQLEKVLQRLGKEKNVIDAELADPASYEIEHKVRLADALKRQAEIAAQLAETESAWLNEQAALEQLGL
ncbi:ATP-binding cassette domain-containing protein [Mycoavidus sp. SF9855]|uniref:ATP-binding cassette domain-containing protein n=1 Tax=Mycoavidus sp. SF9855 TaxID=2968475 RepID=UPI00211BE92F|nr:ATP-binding cassette domain-containing protein [Mycoavidus sp. SF9855]UUM22278.1 ATP-binding cassette domain-containing protein [Mycoavidus sp. SF9855]